MKSVRDIKKMKGHFIGAMIMLFLSAGIAFAKMDFGDFKSETLVLKSWQALIAQNFSDVSIYTDKCIKLYEKKAKLQQSELTQKPDNVVAPNYWALNDVGTAYFIQAKALFEQGNYAEVSKICNFLITNFSFSQCYDTEKGSYWSVKEACENLLMQVKYKGLDFGDYTSECLTKNAWSALGEKKFDHAIIYAEKCISLYENDAEKQANLLTGYSSKEDAFNYWALNDVGTAYFILGEAYSGEKKWEKAYKSYNILIEKYPYCQCWDPRGWFWKPAVSARGKLNKIKAEQGISD